jgi:hypothetical protein
VSYIAPMADILLGLLAILAGGVMLFAGQFALRIVLPIWGFFAGFAFGAGIFAELADERFLGTALGWVSGLVFALIFALLAYFFYAVAVILAMAAFGFAIGSGLVVALGIDWNWVAVLVGVAVGAVIGIVSIVGNMPMVVLAVLSSVAGAVSVVAGLMLLFGILNSEDFTQASFSSAVDASWIWWVVLVVLAVIGIVAQTRGPPTRRPAPDAARLSGPPLGQAGRRASPVLRLDRDGVDLGGRVTGPLVDAQDRLGAGRLGDAPDHPRLGVAPRALEVDPFLALDVDVRLVRGSERLRRDTGHPVVNVHELGHGSDLLDGSPVHLCTGSSQFYSGAVGSG